MLADLHVHSIFSDGSLSPEELIALAKKRGLTTIALADHDTVEGLNRMITAGKNSNIEVIPAVELSTYMENAEIHILAYFIDYQSKKFLKEIKRLFDIRIERARKMVSKLNEMGIKISFTDIQKMAGDKYIGRPHIARALVKANYINEIDEAFTSEYIGNGGRAYVAKERIAPDKAINLIHQAGGIAVLAHPYFISKGDPFNKEDIKKLMAKGLDGIEVYHSKHNQEVSNYYYNIAKELDLIITGGSDFHGQSTPEVKLGEPGIDETQLLRLKAAVKKKKN
ncbi:MAG: PHP domain-containing protein [bacterium]